MIVRMVQSHPTRGKKPDLTGWGLRRSHNETERVVFRVGRVHSRILDVGVVRRHSPQVIIRQRALPVVRESLSRLNVSASRPARIAFHLQDRPAVVAGVVRAVHLFRAGGAARGSDNETATKIGRHVAVHSRAVAEAPAGRDRRRRTGPHDDDADGNGRIFPLRDRRGRAGHRENLASRARTQFFPGNTGINQLLSRDNRADSRTAAA